ncbi:transcriptional regulator, partial [Paenibacillus riograndensis]
MEPDKKSETKEKIMQATLERTKQNGFESITIRKIAEASGTNVSLVNYYFGSKENLISESIKMI